ncbi:MAG TPA: hypothetical protein VER03_06745 [Bryobacteraceae bacterium]|nr:hypothetical protein [Bryobacteraceae bacterium]
MTGKAALLTIVVVVSNVAGNLLLSLGLKSDNGMVSPLVAGGVALLILWTLARMTLMSWADLSYILPITAIGYVLSAITGKLFLAENITPLRWSGTLLIVAGIVLVGRTQAETR